MTRSRNEVVVYKPALDLGLLWYYSKLKRDVQMERSKYQKLRQQVLSVCNLYFSQFEKEANVIKKLRQEIRYATKGTPATIEQSSITSDAYLFSGTEQLFNAQQHLLKDAHRKLMRLTHPDRGGDPELFHAVNAAYEEKDLTYMLELWIALKDESNLYWRQSEGIAYQLQECERPKVSAKMLRNAPEFRIMQLHVSGKKEQASVAALKYLQDLAITLNNELMSFFMPKPQQTYAEVLEQAITSFDMDVHIPNQGASNDSHKEESSK